MGAPHSGLTGKEVSAMGMDVKANGRSILHKGHGQTHTCAPPDVCKTPTPGGPVPIPYINIGMDSDITDGAESVKIEGNPVANVGAKISMTSGDEPGTAGGGIISSKVKGTVTWKMGSLDVKAEGKMVVRFMEQGFHNGNSGNTTFIAPGETGLKYADDFEEELCPVCNETRERHEIVETKSSAELCSKIIEYLQNRWNEVRNGDDVSAKMNVAKLANYDEGIPTFSERWTFAGYMVGVMICACNPPKSFAAMSGGGGQDEAGRPRNCLPAFKDGCREAGIDVVINGGGAGGQPRSTKWQDLARANTSISVAVADTLAQQVERRWKAIKGEGFVPPGKCAGQHLLGRSGHAPTAMTEMYFAAPEGVWGRQYNFLVDGERAPRLFASNLPETPQNPWGSSVGSCNTCQRLLFMTMCPERVCR